MVWPLSDVTKLAHDFSTVATADPVSAVLLLVGAVLTLGTLLFFAYLSVGGILAWVVPERTGRTPRRV